MPDVKVYIRREDFELWKQLKNKSQAVSDMLNSTKGKVKEVRVVRTVPTGGTLEKVDKRNPDIQLVIDTWDKALGMPDGTQAENRRYAKLLIDKRGLERAAGAITAFQAIKGKKYSPKITGLKSLYYKWGDLEDYYLRKKADDEDPERELTQDELNKEFGL